MVEQADIDGPAMSGPRRASALAEVERDRAADRGRSRIPNYVAAIIKLRDYDDTYLYVARPLDPRVLAQLQRDAGERAEYASLDARRVGVQVAFALMYTVIALIVLLSAVWIGLNFANRLVAPIRRLIGAANWSRPAISMCRCRCAGRRAISPSSARPSTR